VTTNRRKDKLASANYDRIAREIFARAETMGIKDRRQLEEVTKQAIKRFEANRPLPGMEGLVTADGRALAPSQIEAVLNEVIAETTAVKVSEPVKPGAIFSENALTVLEKRYLKKDDHGKAIEKPDELLRRVARHIASAEPIHDPKADVRAWEERFFDMMARLDYLPNSPTLMNAGRELGQLSACFVLPVEDSMEAIFETVKYTALIHKSGGGTGFSFSRIRPEGDRVGSTGGVASGPISFMKAFDTATDVIKQGGMRRGANMGILRVDHPDILKFIACKEDGKTLSNFNLSVAVTNEFMQAVEKGGDYTLINPRTGQPAGTLNSSEVFNKIVDLAWRTGDPGIVFIDRINQYNPTPKLGKIESTNPCGEQPLLPYESCNLGSINLAHMVTYRDGIARVDWDKLTETIRTAVRFLDDTIDVNQFPLPQIEERTRSTRKIGLGVMGFADMLILLGIPYDSVDGLDMAERVMKHLSQQATRESVELARERGTFPAFQGSVYDKADAPKVRNAARTTIAPTGTLSILAGCSSGIEPLFALSYVRHVLDGNQLIEVNPYFEKVAREQGFYTEELMRQLAQGARLKNIEGVPELVKRTFVTAHDITPEWHVKMQAAFQRYTDSAVSKTVNFPHDATREDVSKVYMLSYKEGVKGITIYRDGSKEGQVLTVGTSATAPAEVGSTGIPAAAGGKLEPRKRPKTTNGVTERVSTGCGSLYVTVNSDEHGICEVFSSLGKAGGCASAQLEATCRLISLALRSGINPDAIAKNLRGIRCPSIAWEDGTSVLSCADAIAAVLQRHLKESVEESPTPAPAIELPREDFGGLSRSSGGQCPDCGQSLVYQEGCHICPSCGYTKCG
jgi:ribonucleoside-diphosphate reductase alpha chain